MKSATRLFDCIDIQKQGKKEDFLSAKVSGAWKLYSTDEVHEKIYQLAAALLEMGISAGDGTTEGRDKVGLISNSGPEWLIIDLAAFLVSDFSAYVNGEIITIDGGEWLQGAGQFNRLEMVTDEMWDNIEQLTRSAKGS